MASTPSSLTVSDDLLKLCAAREAGVDESLVEIRNSAFAEGLPRGQNIASIMRSVEVEAEVRGTTSRHHFMIKFQPVGYVGKMIEEVQMFRGEIDAYTKMTPALLKMQKPNEEGGNGGISVPKVYYASTEEGVLIMEDLRQSNFVRTDRKKAMSLDQLRLVMDQLALFHATSYHFVQTYPGGADQFKLDFPTTRDIYWLGSHGQATAKFVDLIIKSLPRTVLLTAAEEMAKAGRTFGRGDGFLEGVTRALADVSGRFKDILTADESRFNCVVHSDPHGSNFMFRTVDGRQEMKLLDLQMICYNRPSVDLAYCLGASMTPECRRQHMIELLRYYHERLSEQLRHNGYEPETVYPKAQFKKDMKDCQLFTLVIAALHTNLWFGPKFPGEQGETEEEVKEFVELFVESVKKEGPHRERLFDLLAEVMETKYFEDFI